MKKLLIFVFITATLLMASACDSKKPADQLEKNIALSDLQESMLAADTTLPKMTEVSNHNGQPEQNFRYLSDFDYKMVDSYFYTCATEGTAEEIAVIKLKDKKNAAELMRSLHKHIDEKQGIFQEYAPDQVKLIENAVVTRNENYIALIVSTKNGLVQKAFQSCFE